MKPKKRISTLWFTLPILGILIPPIGLVLLAGFGLFVLLVIANFFEMLFKGGVKPDTELPSGPP